MRRTSRTTLLILLAGFAIHAFAGASLKRESSSTNARTLELSTSVAEAYSCAPKSMALRLRLSYKNTGTEPLIIDKRAVKIVDRYMVSRNLKDATNRNYVVEMRAEDFGGNYGWDAKTEPAWSGFALLQPGEAYEIDDRSATTTFIVDDDRPNAKGSLFAGDYFLQVQVDTWSYSGNAVELRRRWKDQGYLWSNPLISTPMSFSVQKSRQIRPCP